MHIDHVFRNESEWDNVEGTYVFPVPEGASMSGDELKTTGKIAGGAPLLRSYPNSFNAETILGFTLPQATSASLVIYDVLDQRIRTLADGEMVSGNHRVAWGGRNEAGQQVSSGVYLMRLIGDRGERQVRKMVLLR